MQPSWIDVRHGQIGPVLRLMRPQHWVKNLVVAAPLFFSPWALDAANVGRVLVALVAFCLIASAVYVVNDWRDRASDRLHPLKRHRPLAAGTVSATAATVTAALLLAAGFGSAAVLGGHFVLVAAGYLGLNLAYSFGLKNVSIIDVLAIALGFVLRVEAGSAAIGVTPSVWILICTGLLALFLAVAKRRDDIVLELEVTHRASLSGYNRRFLDITLAVVLAALLIAYMIYTTDADVMARLGTERLYLTVPFVVAGVLRYLQITFVEERSGSPTDLILSDRFLILAVLGWVAMAAVLLYG